MRRGVLPSGPASAPLATARDDYRRAHDLVERYYPPNALETAIPLLNAVVQKDAAYAPAWADLGRANFLQFWQLRDATYVEPARAASLQALALNPNLASVHVTLGLLYTETGQHDLATQKLTDALRLDSRNAEAYSALAELYYRQGRAADVEPTFRKSIDLDPGNWRLFNEFGYYFIRAGKFDLAADQYAKAVALTPDNPRALNNLGLCYWRLNRLPEARDTFVRAIQLEPSANRYVSLGRVLAEKQNFSAAAERFKQAIALDPNNYLAWGELANAYQRTGNATQGRDAYMKALSLAEELGKTRTKDPLRPMIARLPQTVLGRENGALAVVAHVDAAYGYSYTANNTPQNQSLKDVLVRLMLGQPVGHATDQLNLRWAGVTARLLQAIESLKRTEGEDSAANVEDLWVARDDARNYVVLGDPAVRLRVNDMAPAPAAT